MHDTSIMIILSGTVLLYSTVQYLWDARAAGRGRAPLISYYRNSFTINSLFLPGLPVPTLIARPSSLLLFRQ
jgi:hypothetical protein